VYLKTKILLLTFLMGLGLNAQSFLYQYTDPCTKEIKTINADMSSPIIISYYGQVKSFTFEELQNGSFDLWMNSTYNTYRNASPCQGAVVTTTATSSSNQVYSVISSVMSITSIDFSSISSMGSNMSGVGSSVGQTTNLGSNSKGSNSGSKSDDPKKSSTSNENSGGSSSGGGSENGGGNGSSGGSEGTGGSGSDGNGSSGGSSGSGGSGGKGNSGEVTESNPTDGPKDEKSVEVENEQAQTGQNTGKTTDKAKNEVQKPAILLTGDIVGVQTVQNGAQDARGTMSFTRVKGDGTASIGFSADYMINSRIGNLSAVKSWIGTNDKGHKHINLVNAGFNYLPKSWSATGMFIRVNSLEKFTAIYGVAGSYGSLFEEEIISTMTIAGFMYKGKITKSLDGTIILAGIYSPYSKYYQESLFESSPILIPFLNLTYKLTKTFGFGLTGGGTYIAGQDVVNYQLLLGAKIIL
jgi:hypothetical protein